MYWWQAIILGLVEGLTEYLPVSSTGHLLVVQSLMGMSTTPEAKEAADAYAICIQAGAIIAVLGLYRGRAVQVAWGLMGRDAAGLRLAVNLAAAFLPAAVLGLLLNDLIKAWLFDTWAVVLAWVAGGVAILAVTWWQKRRGASQTGDEDSQERGGVGLDAMTWRMAVVIGVAQCIAMWPGTSRSLVTIVGGVLVGLTLASAVEFSFLLGVITLGAATAYDALKHGDAMLASYGVPEMLLGAAAAFVSALLAVRWMVAYLKRHGLAIFGWYRIAIGVVVAGLLLAGWVDAGGAGASPEAAVHEALVEPGEGQGGR